MSHPFRFGAGSAATSSVAEFTENARRIEGWVTTSAWSPITSRSGGSQLDPLLSRRHSSSRQPRLQQQLPPPGLAGARGGDDRRAAKGGGMDFGSDTDAMVGEKVSWVREAAGERFEQLELAALIWQVVVTDHPRSAAKRVAPRWGHDRGSGAGFALLPDGQPARHRRAGPNAARTARHQLSGHLPKRRDHVRASGRTTAWDLIRRRTRTLVTRQLRRRYGLESAKSGLFR
jgi:hypothetical protein